MYWSQHFTGICKKYNESSDKTFFKIQDNNCPPLTPARPHTIVKIQGYCPSDIFSF